MTSGPTSVLPCPKCLEPMVTVERSGVHLEICPECKGLFLDRGELDRLLDLEARGTGAVVEPRDDRAPYEPRGMDSGWSSRHRRDDDDDDDDDDRWGDRRGRGRRRGFLGDLLEGLVD
jgi:uncharacterized protein